MSTEPRQALEGALARLDERGRFRREDTAVVRRAVTELDFRSRPPVHPTAVFGRWEELAPAARAALRSLAAADIHLTMRYHPRGALWPALVRGLASLDRTLYEHRRWPRMRTAAIRWSGRVWSGPRHAREAAFLTAARMRWRRARRVGVADLLAELGRLPRWTTGDYVRDVPVDPRCRTFFHDPERNVLGGLVVGVDLIPAADGVWCVEANPNSGLGPKRKDRPRPFGLVTGIVEFAHERGMRRILWLGTDQLPVWPWMLEDLWDETRRLGLELDVRDDVRVPRRHDLPSGIPTPSRRLTTPRDIPPDTLVVLRNEYGVGPDHVLADKDLFMRCLDSAVRESGDTRVRAHRMTRRPQDVTPPADPGLPNLVYKYPDSMQGKGVHFLRARDQAHAEAMARDLDRAHHEPPGFFQPFVCARLLPGRRIYDVRGNFLLTPAGTTVLHTVRREGVRSIPERIDEGLVREKGIFASNVSQGNRIAPVPDEERDEVRAATAAVAENMARLLARGFRTTT